jgi:hypothetical protein
MLNSASYCIKYSYMSFTDLLGMEQYDLHGQRRDMKHKGRNVVWSIAMDKCLIESLAIQAKNGNKIDKCFNENAYTAACIAVNSHFNLNLNNQKVVNRLKTIKKRYKIIKDMLSQDGFRWNPNAKMIECDNDDLWKRYIAVSYSFFFSFVFFLLFFFFKKSLISLLSFLFFFALLKCVRLFFTICLLGLSFHWIGTP